MPINNNIFRKFSFLIRWKIDSYYLFAESTTHRVLLIYNDIKYYPPRCNEIQMQSVQIKNHILKLYL